MDPRTPPEVWPLGGPNTDPHKVFGGFWKTTWRIIPISKWLITMVCKSPNWGYSPSKSPKWLRNGGYYLLTNWDDPQSRELIGKKHVLPHRVAEFEEEEPVATIEANWG